MRRIPIGSRVVLGLSVISPRLASAQGSPCLTNPDTAAMHIASVRVTLQADSAALAAQGLPYNPALSAVTLVTKSSTCSKVVAAYNAPYPTNDPGRITKAYVMKVGNRVYAAVTPKSDILNFYDTKFRAKAVMVPMD